MRKGWFTRIRKSSFEGNNYVGNFSSIYQSELGKMTYVGQNCSIMYTKIGRYCSLAGDVKIIFGKHPTKEFVSTHPAFYSPNTACGVSYLHECRFDEYDYIDDKKTFMVEIGNDVWIGSGVKIIGGVKIGDGAIVLAGAVVTNDVEPYGIVGGVPAKVIDYRFDRNEIDLLMNTKWWEWDTNFIKANAISFRTMKDFEKIIKKD